MAICCVVCSEWYPEDASDRLDICPTCFDMNFASAQPPLDAWGSARATLEAALAPASPLSARQRAAMVRLHLRWEAEAQQRVAEEGA